ncbi:MAG: multicopper oxidase domain-containing protein [Geminicoccaceae bacterium]
MFGLDRTTERALKLRQELIAAKLGRRELAKLGLVSGGAYFARGASLRQAIAATVSALPLTPWLDPMPVPRAAPANSFDYAHDTHQYCTSGYDAMQYASLKISSNQHRFHSQLPPSEVWSYTDRDEFGGPLIDVHYGQPVCFGFENDIDADYVGYSTPETTAHLHNFHTASESDGGPWNFLHPKNNRAGKPNTRIQHYLMARAGFKDPLGPGNPLYRDTTGLAPGGSWWAPDHGGGDLREALTTLFMHDHSPGFTAPNLYKGLFLMVRAFEPAIGNTGDTGDETTGWRLPSGDYDVPLMFQDKEITPSGEMTFNPFLIDGFTGAYQTVNGAYKPYFEVERRKYRFRLLDGGPSRFYRFVLRKGTTNVKFTQITASGNLLYVPKTGLTELDLWVAERSDIIVDFTNFQEGDEIIMSNILSMRADGRGEEVGKRLNPDDPANQLLKFKVVGSQPADDPSQVPQRFRPLPPLPDLSKLPRKLFKFERKNGSWAINGRFWDPDFDHTSQAIANPLNQVKRDSAEIWTLDSSSGGWDHPMHIHFEEGQIIATNGVSIPEAARHRIDVYRLRQSKHDVVLRFRDFPQTGFTQAGGDQAENTSGDRGRYVMHCHNVVHEDHAMMTTWSIRE